jgi:hypothetical protein
MTAPQILKLSVPAQYRAHRLAAYFSAIHRTSLPSSHSRRERTYDGTTVS